MRLVVTAGMVFTVLHFAGGGAMTIAGGTWLLLLYGPAGSGARQGQLMMPAQFVWAFTLFLRDWLSSISLPRPCGFQGVGDR